MKLKILEHLKGNKKYIFEISGYYFPIYVINPVSGTRVNLEANRKDSIERPKSSYVKNFEHDWKGPILIPEFPIIIENRELYLNLLEKYNIKTEMMKNPKYSETMFIKKAWGKSYFLLDYYIPGTTKCIEIDGEFHKDPGMTELDKARDEYILEMYGIKTFRLPRYSRKSKNLLDEIISEKSQELKIDFTDSIVKDYKIHNEEQFRLYEEAKTQIIGIQTFDNSREIKIPAELIEGKYLIRNVGFMKKAVDVFKLYGKDLMIIFPPSQNPIKPNI